MLKLVAILGGANSGKSTIIRTLTGCPTKKHRDFVEDKHTGKSIYVVCSSPQEEKFSQEELVDILSKVAERKDCQGVVMAIQPNRPTERLSMEKILEAASNRQFEVFAFVIDSGYLSGSADIKEINMRLAAVNITPTVLNGSRFSLINAQIINDATHIVS